MTSRIVIFLLLVALVVLDLTKGRISVLYNGERVGCCVLVLCWRKVSRVVQCFSIHFRRQLALSNGFILVTFDKFKREHGFLAGSTFFFH